MKNARKMGEPGLRGWPGIGIRLLATLFFLWLMMALSHCSAPTVSPVATPTTRLLTAQLSIEVSPKGASVLVDGFRSGTTPIVLELPAGQHTIRVEMDGYEPMEQTITLAGGDGAIIDGNLEPLAPDALPTATPTPVPTPGAIRPLPDLVVAHIKIELETGSACDYASTKLGLRVWIENTGDADAGPFVVDANGSQQMVETGLAAGETTALWFAEYVYSGENTVLVDATSQVKESSEDNNRLSQMIPIPTLPPTCTPPPDVPTDTPTPTPTPLPPTSEPAAAPSPTSAVDMREGQITIPTYPYADFTTQAWNDIFNMPYAVLDRAAYEASNPVARDVTYRTLVVENEYLALTFLPDLGGRLYEVIFKPTGHRETYRNPVLKPSPWGPPEQGWWLAAGGIEWCLPVEEHGYEWGERWRLVAGSDANGVTVTLRDTAADVKDRVQAVIVVRLEAGVGYFTIRPRLENPTGAPATVKYWTNAMLAPGGPNTPSADLRFVLPDAVTEVTIHSRGDESLPGYDERMSWPVFNGTDLSRLGNWNRWLGFFEDPAVGGFMAVYDEGYDEGMVRIFPADVAQGAKGFAFGWSDPIAASNWTDDSSSYVEIHGGPASTFDDSVTLPAGGHLQWTETWYPVAGLGGMRYANEAAALNLEAGSGQAEVAVAATRPWSGDVVLLLNGQERWRQTVSLVPGQPLRDTISLGDDAPQTGRLALRLEAPDGSVVAEYIAEFNLK